MKARDNPFAVDRVLRIRYRLPEDSSWDVLITRMESMNYRAAIVGPKGRGKTTLWEDLGKHLIQQGQSVAWLRLNERDGPPTDRDWDRFLSNCAAEDVLFLDSAGLLRRRDWRRLQSRTQRLSGLVITAHQEGWLPTLIHCHTSPELLSDIVGQLVPRPSSVMRHALVELFHKHDGNLRDALRELYDLYAEGNCL